MFDMARDVAAPTDAQLEAWLKQVQHPWLYGSKWDSQERLARGACQVRIVRLSAVQQTVRCNLTPPLNSESTGRVPPRYKRSLEVVAGPLFAP